MTEAKDLSSRDKVMRAKNCPRKEDLLESLFAHTKLYVTATYCRRSFMGAILRLSYYRSLIMRRHFMQKTFHLRFCDYCWNFAFHEIGINNAKNSTLRDSFLKIQFDTRGSHDHCYFQSVDRNCSQN